MHAPIMAIKVREREECHEKKFFLFLCARLYLCIFLLDSPLDAGESRVKWRSEFSKHKYFMSPMLLLLCLLRSRYFSSSSLGAQEFLSDVMTSTNSTLIVSGSIFLKLILDIMYSECLSIRNIKVSGAFFDIVKFMCVQ